MEFGWWKLARLESERGYGDSDGDEDVLMSMYAVLPGMGSYDRREYSGGDEPENGDAYLSTTLVMLRNVEVVVRLLRELAML